MEMLDEKLLKNCLEELNDWFVDEKDKIKKKRDLLPALRRYAFKSSLVRGKLLKISKNHIQSKKTESR